MDWRGLVERHLEGDDPEAAYYVSQALEECALARPFAQDRELPMERWMGLAALADPCGGLEESRIEPDVILGLLRQAAGRGEPRATARMLLFRDIAAPKDDVLEQLPALLATRDPAVIRDVGAFLSRGESVWRFGTVEVAADAAAIAWELAACDLGYACGPTSRIARAQCAFDGRCAAGRYEDRLALHEPPELMAEAQRLRGGIVRALLRHDWSWLGLV